MYRKLALAFSLANLCFFKTWREILNPQAVAYLYLWKQDPGFAAIVALISNVLALTAIFFFGFTLAWRSSNPHWRNAVRVAFLVILLRALNGVRIQFQSLSTGHLRLVFGRIGFFVLGVSLLALLMVVIARYGLPRVTRVAAFVALILFPFGVIGFTQATFQLIKYRALVSHERPSLPLLPVGKDQRRVLWVIFDEMSADVAFQHRPVALRMPEFDRFQSVALSATNAYPPAGRTLQSIPALLTGRLVADVKPAGPEELLLTFPSQNESVGWSQQPDILTTARKAGLNAALVGWYHPYCRIIGDRLTSCFWQPASQVTTPEKFSVARALLLQNSDLLRLVPFTAAVRQRLQPQETDFRAAHLTDYLALADRAAQLAANPEINLAFVHLPVPHPPYIYDRNRGVWDTTGPLSYLDNLALADLTLGKLRQAMERNGTWDNTTIVISSDHWWRTEYWDIRKPIWSSADDSFRAEGANHRIPFLVKLAGQKTSVMYDASFNTVLTHDLVLDILSGKVAAPEGLTGWLDTHKSIGESPYQAYDDSP
ncbi:MAG TPA: sulfatase-like hydrolase/transferase [Pyrinomonadaceae bacterium]|jgi:hypothetical protein|nr:sulfatase-like hydrolase/transferase [Pyrinomonadaceae bacterium]